MLARIRGAIDSQLAAEQAKVRATSSSPSAGRPSRSSSRARNAPKPGEIEKDPSEFEESDVATTPVTGGTPARAGTPVQSEAITEDPLGGDEAKEKDVEDKPAAAADAPNKTAAAAKPASSTGSLASNTELPTEVRVKLRKLEKIEGKYADLLRSYKIVHARNSLIEPFEKALRENTPVESIADPKSLIDYINSFSLRSDMVKEELIRVSKEKDEYKATAQKLQDQLDNKEKEPKKGQEKKAPKDSKKSDDIFNFDEEHEDLGFKVKELEETNTSLKSELETAQQAKKVAEEAVEIMQKSVEDAQSELEGLRETGKAKETKLGSLQSKAEISAKQVEGLNVKIEKLSGEMKKLSTEASESKIIADTKSKEAATNVTALEATKKELEDLSKKLEAEAKTSEQLRKTVKGQLEQLVKYKNESADAKTKLDASTKELERLKAVKIGLERAVVKLEGQLQQTNSNGTTTPAQRPSTHTPSTPAATEGTGGGGKKKKNKKKKKGCPAAPVTSTEDHPVKESETVDDEPENDTAPTTSYSETIIVELQGQLEQMKQELSEKDNRISALAAKARQTDSLKEEIESLRDDLVDVGQDHVTARQKLKEQSKELIDINVQKQELKATIERLEGEVRELKAKQSSVTDEAYKTLATDFAKLKESASTLETELTAVQRLAEMRFKEIAELKGVIDNAKSERISLRTENSSLVATKNDMSKQLADLKRLERTERDLKNDLQILNKKMTDKDNEISSLRKKSAEEASRRLKSEGKTALVAKDLRKAEADRKSAVDAAERVRADLSRTHEEMSTLKQNIASLEKEQKALRVQRDELKEELELKAAQLDSSQSLMNSMRDQASELAMQTREAQEQRESTEEELAEARHLLTERTREAETMRRMLSEVETRHEARSREMKERIDTISDERDKAEEEVATVGRRRAREIEELKDRFRDAERGLRRAEEARELAEKELGGLKDAKLRMEASLEQKRRELEDTKKAMASMTSALGDTDGQVREIERQKAELRSRAEEAESKFEKLQKQQRALQDEVRSIQTARAKAFDNDGSPSRSSTDSRTSRPMSPRAAVQNGGVDLMYLKNVLLQFMELRDKSKQRQLIPALKMLLELDSSEERKWLQVVQAR